MALQLAHLKESAKEAVQVTDHLFEESGVALKELVVLFGCEPASDLLRVHTHPLLYKTVFLLLNIHGVV